MNRNRKSRRGSRIPPPRPDDDAFDYWLRSVATCIVEPTLDLLRVAWDVIRGPRPPGRAGGKGDASGQPQRFNHGDQA
jgi:hypothetical protein